MRAKLTAFMAVFLFIVLLSSPVLAADWTNDNKLYKSDNFSVDFYGIGTDLLKEPDRERYEPNSQGIEPLKSLTIYEQSTVAPRRTNSAYFRTSDYFYIGTKEPNTLAENLLFLKHYHYLPASKEISKNFVNIIEARGLGYNKPMITTLTYTRDFLEDYWFDFNKWDKNIDSVNWLLQIPTIEYYRTGSTNPEENQKILGYTELVGLDELTANKSDADALKDIVHNNLERSSSVYPGFEPYIKDMISRAEFINLRPEENGMPLRIPFFTFTQVDLIEEGGEIIEVNIPIKAAPLENYLTGNKINIKPYPGASIKEWVVSNRFIEPSAWSEVKTLPILSSGTGTPTINTMQRNTVIYVLHQKQPANPPDFYIKSLTANTSSTEPNKKYSGSVVYGLKDNGFPAQAKLSMSHNGYGISGIDGQTVTFQPEEEKIFNFNFTGQNSNSLLFAKIDPVGIIDANPSDNHKMLNIPQKSKPTVPISSKLTLQAVSIDREVTRPASEARWTDWVTATLTPNTPSAPRGTIDWWKITKAEVQYPWKNRDFTFGNPLQPQGTLKKAMTIKNSNHIAEVEFQQDWSMDGTPIYHLGTKRWITTDKPRDYPIKVNYTIEYQYSWTEWEVYSWEETDEEGNTYTEWEVYSWIETRTNTVDLSETAKLLVTGTGVDSRAN